jgi:hypothetical protein
MADHEVLYEAVRQQLRPKWFALSGSQFDSRDTLESKRAGLDRLKAWVADTVSDRAMRKAYQRWIEAADYTIRRAFEELDKREQAHTIALPPLPR